MEIKTGDRFLSLETGDLFEITAVSKHKTMVNVKYRNKNHYDWIQIMEPLRIQQVEQMLKSREWVPDTPAARTLYGNETRKR